VKDATADLGDEFITPLWSPIFRDYANAIVTTKEAVDLLFGA
jgi:hypothetical protein